MVTASLRRLARFLSGGQRSASNGPRYYTQNRFLNSPENTARRHGDFLGNRSLALPSGGTQRLQRRMRGSRGDGRGRSLFLIAQRTRREGTEGTEVFGGAFAGASFRGNVMGATEYAEDAEQWSLALPCWIAQRTRREGTEGREVFGGAFEAPALVGACRGMAADFCSVALISWVPCIAVCPQFVSLRRQKGPRISPSWRGGG